MSIGKNCTPLHWLRIELHERQDFRWHLNLDREPELPRLLSSERIVVSPVSSRNSIAGLCNGAAAICPTLVSMSPAIAYLA